MKLDSKLRSIFFVPEKKWSRKAFLLFFGFYLIINLLVALPKGTSTPLSKYTPPNPDCLKHSITPCKPNLELTPKSTAKDYLQFFGVGDPASYVRGGLLLAGKEWGGAYPTVNLSILKRLKLMNLIGFGLWPPGMYVLNALPLMVSTAIPLGMYHVLVASILWAITFALIASLLILRARLWLALLVPILLLSFPLFHGYFLRYGIMYSEADAAAFLTMGFSLVALNYYRKSNRGIMVAAGLCFAVASFFRSQIFPVAIGVSLILTLLYLITIWTSRANLTRASHRLKSAPLFFLLGFYLPIGSYLTFNEGALFNASYVWEIPFLIPASKAGAAEFLVSGGMRAACIVDEERCETLHNQIKPGAVLPNAQREVVKSFLLHPIKFSSYKLPIAWKFWIAENKYDSLLILAIFLCCLIFMLVRKLWLFLSLTLVSVALVLGPPFLLHFEVRYFYLIKVMALFLPFWLLFISSPKIQSYPLPE